VRQIWGCGIVWASTNERNLGSGAVYAVASDKHACALLVQVGYLHHVHDYIA